MKRQDFDSLIDSLVESVGDYVDNGVDAMGEINDAFDAYDAVHEICSRCDHSSVTGKAWTLVNYARSEDRELFLDAESESLLIGQANGHDLTLDAMMLSVAFQILKLETLKRYFAKVEETGKFEDLESRAECSRDEFEDLETDNSQNV
tara:strand:- start:376 stop:819 length:444 start_codon:yes stop_codon:yes gene_type:complete